MLSHCARQFSQCQRCFRFWQNPNISAKKIRFIASHSNHEKTYCSSAVQNQDGDFFGLESDSKHQCSEPLQPKIGPKVPLKSSETLEEVTFGTIRRDFANVPVIHGQFGGQPLFREDHINRNSSDNNLMKAITTDVVSEDSFNIQQTILPKSSRSRASFISQNSDILKTNQENKALNDMIASKLKQSADCFDSKGFRILKKQVLDLTSFTRAEIISILKSNVLHMDDDLVVLNKPYNLVLHDSASTQHPCLSQYLDDFAKAVEPNASNSKLYTVHRLDREATGCLLLARNETIAERLKAMFAQRTIIKKYWVVTSGVPDPLKGVIDIPISEGKVENKKRMVLHPKLPSEVDYKSHSKAGKRAVTSYHVKSISGSAAFVEVTPLTGVKHQIRVHFGFGLACPILGDHKYSHLDKMVPQTLPSDILQRLFVRQAKVRHIPMHLHAYSITIPEYRDGKNLYVSAPLPYHMAANMKRLKFKKMKL